MQAHVGATDRPVQPTPDTSTPIGRAVGRRTVTPQPGAVADPAEPTLDLQPEPGAVRDARDWVSRMLAGWDDDRVETARLLISELVTNAILHARTAISVRFVPDGARARFEVGDHLSAGPSHKRFAPDSVTGRGLRLVAALADDWGVSRAGDGKVVWFVLAPTAERPPAGGLDAVFLQDIGDLAMPGERAQDAPEPAPPDAPSMEIRILDLPIEVYLDAEQHNDAVLRELELIVQSSANPGTAEVPRRLLELASAVRAAFAHATTGIRFQVEAAIARGDVTVDIRTSVPRVGWEALLSLADQLDELDTFCEEGELLTLASPPRLRWFRTWYAAEVARQMRGGAPSAWREQYEESPGPPEA